MERGAWRPASTASQSQTPLKRLSMRATVCQQRSHSILPGPHVAGFRIFIFFFFLFWIGSSFLKGEIQRDSGAEPAEPPSAADSQSNHFSQLCSSVPV